MHDVLQEQVPDIQETVEKPQAQETLQTIEYIEKTVEGTSVAILVSSGGCAIGSQCGVLVIQK